MSGQRIVIQQYMAMVLESGCAADASSMCMRSPELTAAPISCRGPCAPASSGSYHENREPSNDGRPHRVSESAGGPC